MTLVRLYLSPAMITQRYFVKRRGIGVVNLVASMLPLVALFQVFDGLSGVTGGVLRARGKQVSPFSHSRTAAPSAAVCPVALSTSYPSFSSRF